MLRVHRFVAFTLVLVALPAAVFAQNDVGSADMDRSFSANTGIYNNRMPLQTISPPYEYTSVCIVNGEIERDPMVAGGTRLDENEANCPPSVVGWVIETQEREPVTWAEARLECRKDGMRLPEPFEWQISCLKNVELGLGLNGMTGEYEWASNFATHQHQTWQTPGGFFRFNAYVAAAIMGKEGCGAGSYGAVGNAKTGVADSVPYRCVR